LSRTGFAAHSLTPKIKDDGQPFLQRPAVIGIGLLVACVGMNIVFW
jgi:hypothetical protein